MEFNGLVSKRVGRNANPFMFFKPLVQQKNSNRKNPSHLTFSTKILHSFFLYTTQKK
jgi:hypothetical protein